MSFDKNEHEESCCSCGCCESEQHHEHNIGCGCEHSHANESGEIIRIVLAAALCVLLIAFGARLNAVSGMLYGVLFALPYLIAGADVLFTAIKNIFKGKVFDEQFLMSLATIGAFATGEYPEAVAVMVFYKIGELFEHKAVDKTKRSIEAAMDLRPDTACVIRDGAKITVHPAAVKAGELLAVKAGEKIPLDGTVISGQTTLDTSALTGESAPKFAATGDSVLSGCVNLSGYIEIKAEKEYKDSTVAKISQLIKTAGEKKAKAENFITKFARYYTPIVVTCAVLLFVLPSIITGSWQVWLNRALVFLVVSCPCALVVSVPLTFFAGIGGASRQGILIKGSNYIDALSQIKTVVFDKTGTLTTGSFKIKAVKAINISQEELLSLAAAAESGSNHPIAKAIAAAGSSLTASEFKEIPGKGVTATVQGQKIAAGNLKLMADNGVNAACAPKGDTTVYLAADGKYLGCIELTDEIKPECTAAIKQLKAAGVANTVMLTGDSEEAAAAVAKEIGIDKYYSSLLPGDKVEKAEQLLKNGKLCFVGDGINDAPVLARADVGLAMGGAGSDAAIEAADVVIMDDNPLKVANAIKQARKAMGIVRQNIILALGIKIIVLLLGALGFANMWLAVFADVGVTVLAVLNALRGLGQK